MSWLRLALVCALAGCAGQSFQPTFKPPERPSPERVLADIVKDAPRQERAAMVGVTAEPEKLVAWDGTGRVLWEQDVDAGCAPVIAGDAVVVHESDGLVVRDVGTGARRVVIDEPARLVGADGVGSRLVLSLAYTKQDGPGPRGLLVLVDGGRVRWTHDLKLGVGVPALVGRYVVVPWATHRVSVIAASDGQELARWYFTATVLGHAVADRGSVYLGQHGFLRLHEKLFEQRVEDVHPVAPMRRELPGQPTLLRDGYAPVPEPDNALHRVRVEWRLGTGDNAIENDTLYARFYRVLFAMEGGRDEVRWAHTFDHDLVGAEVRSDGLLVADTSGHVELVAPDGTRRSVAELGRPLTVMALRMGGQWSPPGPPAPASAAAPAAEGTPVAPATPSPLPALSAQLYAVASLPDDRLGAARAYAVNRLARDSAPEVTAQLVALCSDRASPEAVVHAACARLGERGSGGDAVLAALKPVADGEQPVARVGAMARAAAQMGLTAAGPSLLAHFEDLRTDTEELVPLIEAMQQLRDRHAVPALERFLRLHHAEPDGSELHAAVEAAARALGELRAKPTRRTLELVAGDGLSPAATRKAAELALAMLDAPPARAEPVAAAQGKAGAPEAKAAPAAPALPRLLSAEMIEASFRPVQARLVRCLFGGDEPVPSGRIALTVGGSGESKVESVYVTPSSLQACMEPLVRSLSFPATQRGRERITHVVRLPSATAAAGHGKPRAKSRAKAPAKRRAKGKSKAGAKPKAEASAAAKPKARAAAKPRAEASAAAKPKSRAKPKAEASAAAKPKASPEPKATKASSAAQAAGPEQPAAAAADAAQAKR